MDMDIKQDTGGVDIIIENETIHRSLLSVEVHSLFVYKWFTHVM